MKVDFEEFRKILLLIDTEKNIVIFPVSKTKDTVKLPSGNFLEFSYHAAYYPIELKYPYILSQLADKIQEGFLEWGKHPCYEEEYGKNGTFETKYFGEKTFAKAVKGMRHIDIGFGNGTEKEVTFYMPLKRGYAYMRLHNTQLKDDADWIDFAEAVMYYVELDLTTLKSYKVYKNKLNL